MKTLFNIHDTHIGAIRSGGTTPTTAFTLREQLNAKFAGLLENCQGGDLIINGDLFDTFSVPMADLWATIQALTLWLESGDQTQKVWLVVGNHDLSKNTNNLSSSDLLGRVLQSRFEGRVIPVTGSLHVPEHDAYIVSHIQNQDRFDAELTKVPACTTLFLHCNYDNHFATQSDHSLNLSEAQAKALPVKHIVIAHEHQRSRRLMAKVHLPGNQFPSSVADCLGNDAKFMTKFSGDQIEYIQTWAAEGSYCAMDWRSLADNGCDFIRVTGEATAAESSEVISAVSRFRSRSKALVITTAVKVEGQADTEEMQFNADQIAAFDVRSALMEILSAEERAVIEKLEAENV